MGLYMLVFLGGTPIGSPLAGWLAAAYGPRASMIAGGVISALATVVIAALLARRRGVPLRAYARPSELARITARAVPRAC
jgi:MFS family permease